MPKISDLTAILGADTDAADVFPIVDVSVADAVATKRITRAEVAEALGTDQTTWNTGTATARNSIAPSELDAKIADRLNASGSAPTYAPRAWVNFNGTGTVAIRSSGNVASITDNGTGDYTVNFTTSMADVNYAAICSGKFDDTTAGNNILFTPYSFATGSVRINANNSSGAKADCVHVCVGILR